MKKSTIKAFTLVEMLIVIVIIGILIASLMPRMQSAQWRARDVARKNDLSQIQTAIITSQQDRWAWPGMTNNAWRSSQWTTDYTSGSVWMIVDNIAKNLQTAWMTSVPADPNGSNVNFWLWSSFSSSWSAAAWKYIYLVAKRNWVANAWFALMAKTEVEWSSNWVTCDTQNSGKLSWWYIKNEDDLAHITLCKKITMDPNRSEANCKSNQEECVYADTAELRYLLLY